MAEQRCPFGGWIICALTLLVSAAAAEQPVNDGTIRGTITTDGDITRVVVLYRELTKVGTYTRPIATTLERTDMTQLTLHASGLPVPAVFDLKFVFERGHVEGWNTSVPESDYVEEIPLEDVARQALIEKINRAPSVRKGFFDSVAILDMAGNIQHAAVLLHQLRRRAFVGGNYTPGEWVWRVERMQYENPTEDQWAPYQEQPFYALVRRRLMPRAYQALHVTYARHLGGIVLTTDQPTIDLGTIQVPTPTPGVHAIDANGQRIEPIIIKDKQCKVTDS